MTISFLKDELVKFLKENEGSAFHLGRHLIEEALIEEALIACRGNQTKAANLLGVNRGTLVKRLARVKNEKV